MTRKELIRQVATSTGMTQRQIETVLHATLETAIEALAHGDTIRLRDVATISVVQHAGRTAYSFGSNQLVSTAPYVTISLRAADKLRDRISAGISDQASNQISDQHDH